MNTKELQTLLSKKGFKPGKIDGVMGPKTEAALIAFKKSIGFKARAYLGPLTKAALREGVVASPAKVVTGKTSSRKLPPWLRLAYSFLGSREIAGRKHNKKIIDPLQEPLHLLTRWHCDRHRHCRGIGCSCPPPDPGILKLLGLRNPGRKTLQIAGWRMTRFTFVYEVGSARRRIADENVQFDFLTKRRPPLARRCPKYVMNVRRHCLNVIIGK